MALSNESAGHGSASGSAPQLVPASLTASHEAHSVTPEEGALAFRAVVDSQALLRAIGVLARQLLDMSDDDDVQSMAEAIAACSEKGCDTLEAADAFLTFLPDRLRSLQGGVQ